MKAIIQNNITYKVTSEKGDFFVTEDNKGKCKMFLKSAVEVVEVDEMPAAKVYKQRFHTEKSAARQNAIIDQFQNDKKFAELSERFTADKVARLMK